jgi:hypothetical protein
MKDRDYSIISDALKKRSPQEFADYFAFDSVTFVLTADAVKHFDNLCWFSKGRPSDAPVTKPSEWGPLGKILSDEDEEERSVGLKQVEIEHQKPSKVYARIASAKHPLQWEGWLMKVRSLLSAVTFGDSISSEAHANLKQLSGLLSDLDTKDIK